MSNGSGEAEFTRTHPIEGRGLRAGLFQFLLRTNAGSSSAEVAIPDTVAFEHGYPRWWYQFDAKSKEIRRSAGGKDLHAANIHSYFVARPPKLNGKPIGFIAAYTYAAGDINADGSVDGGSVAIEYHTAESLHRFLLKTNDPRKKHGILQSLELPLELCYTVISVMWCPQVHIVRRRASRRMLSDARGSAMDRLVTFDGPEHHSREVNCAEDTKAKVVGACRRIYDHMLKSAHLKLSSMQTFFIISKTGEPVLLWCGSLFLVNPHRTTPMPAVPPTLMLMPTFVGPSAEVSGRDEVAEDLEHADAAQRDIELSMAPSPTKSSRHDPSRPASTDATTMLSSNGGTGGIVTTVGDASAAVGSPAGAAARHRRLRSEAAAAIAERIYANWYCVSDPLSQEYARLLDQHRSAVVFVNDVLYAAHSRFLALDDGSPTAGDASGGASGGGASAVSVEVPFELHRALGDADHVTELFEHIGLHPTDSCSRVAIVPPKQRLAAAVALHPLSKLIADAERWLDDFFAEKHRVLRVQWLPAIEEAISKATALHFVGGMSLEAACVL